MASPSASSSASSGINAPGGSVNRESNVIIFALIAIVLLVFLRRKK